MLLIKTAIYYFLRFIELAIFARVIISWLPIPRDNVVIRFIYQITEPIMAPIRGIIERSALGKSLQMIDLSPIVAFLLIDLLMNVIFRMI